MSEQLRTVEDRSAEHDSRLAFEQHKSEQYRETMQPAVSMDDHEDFDSYKAAVTERTENMNTDIKEAGQRGEFASMDDYLNRPEDSSETDHIIDATPELRRMELMAVNIAEYEDVAMMSLEQKEELNAKEDKLQELLAQYFDSEAAQSLTADQKEAVFNTIIEKTRVIEAAEAVASETSEAPAEAKGESPDAESDDSNDVNSSASPEAKAPETHSEEEEEEEAEEEEPAEPKYKVGQEFEQVLADGSKVWVVASLETDENGNHTYMVVSPDGKETRRATEAEISDEWNLVVMNPEETTEAQETERPSLRDRVTDMLNYPGRRAAVEAQVARESANPERTRRWLAPVLVLGGLAVAFMTYKYGIAPRLNGDNIQAAADVTTANNPNSGGANAATESLARKGDTIWRHAERELVQSGLDNPSDAQVQKYTQRILDANHLSWKEARSLPVGFDFKMPSVK